MDDMQDSRQDLAALLSEGQQIIAGGQTITVRPLTPRQLPAALRALDGLQAALSGGLDLTALDGPALARLAMDHTDDVVHFVAAATARPPEFIGDQISVAELIDLFGAIVAVNADFFVRRVVPALLQTAQLMMRLKSAGQA